LPGCSVVATVCVVTTELIGWASSVILVLTIAKQVHRQWKEGSSEGVSKWLFVGQLVASAGFTAYSVLVKNWVFVVTNSLMLVNAVLGGAIVLWHRRRQKRQSLEPVGS
jgi:MtN3 and saliva related transmembrane protein